MNTDIKQIYHTARCGSTLMVSLLSSVIECYSEPTVTNDNVHQFYGKVIKSYSMAPFYQDVFNGPKVFLYRPLSQQLMKIKNVEEEWFRYRVHITDEIINKHGLIDEVGDWQPRTDLDKISYQWIFLLTKMIKCSNILFIKSNDFFYEKKKTLDVVCDHFNIPKVNDVSISNIYLKKKGINDPLAESTVDHKLKTILQNDDKSLPEFHGVIETSDALKDTDVNKTVNLIENKFPFLNSFLY